MAQPWVLLEYARGGSAGGRAAMSAPPSSLSLPRRALTLGLRCAAERSRHELKRPFRDSAAARGIDQMTTHLSVRLSWHDRGWDGRICDHPSRNSSCIVLDQIRASRDDALEDAHAGRPIAELQDWAPPCSRDPAAYSPIGYSYVHTDPLERGLAPVTELIKPFSSMASAYRFMREENFRAYCEQHGLRVRGPNNPQKDRGWVAEPDRQRALLDHFWGKIEPGSSLVFYYANQGNPLDEDLPRVIVGIGRIKAMSDQFFFGSTREFPEQYPVWARQITQDYPAQGVRIPYQEYLKQGLSTDRILCPVPPSAMQSFLYVGEHLNDDIAVGIVERAIQSIQQVKEDGKVPGNWEASLTWLNDALSEAWKGRGAFPGIGSVLQSLGCEKGTAYHKLVLAPLARSGTNPWEHLVGLLNSNAPIDRTQFQSGLQQARTRWKALPGRQALLETLARFELTPDQVKRVMNPQLRAAAGIAASDDELVANPYIICELDQGSAVEGRRIEPPIALESIDHGMMPEGDAALYIEDRIPSDDMRRFRAIAVDVLRDAARQGDTVLPFHDLTVRISKRFPEARACVADAELVFAQRAFVEERLWILGDDANALVALRPLRHFEERVARDIQQLAARPVTDSTSPNWQQALLAKFPTPTTPREHAALEEKARALDKLYRRRLSVLTGGAGTGKTSVLNVFLKELEKTEGRERILLLAPTGKARVRLSTATGRRAQTIHQFLQRQGWLAPGTYAIREKTTAQPEKASTIIIDECSMIPTDLLGALLSALDLNAARRVVLVGDPNQLPPIGPGRPFVDIIDWLTEHHPDNYAELQVCMRTIAGAEAGGDLSRALTLADGYRSSATHTGDDELLSDVALGRSTGDLDVRFWNSHEELLAAISHGLQTELGIPKGDGVALSRSLGIKDGDYRRSEAWQILSPTRTQFSGTDDLNRLLQREYRAHGLRNHRDRYGRSLRPFGEEQLVTSDKVIQVKNSSRTGWPQEDSLGYVANGEIGIIKWSTSEQTGDSIDVVFSTQPETSYRYRRPEINDNLELAYAITVHKAQGSDFDTVFLILPQSAQTLSRELIYTGLTRFRRKLVLLIERDVGVLRQYRSAKYSATQLRNTNTFRLLLRPVDGQPFMAEALVHRTRNGTPVRSKSEVIVADILESLGLSYDYELPLAAPNDPRDFRLPDFTVYHEGKRWYWEHLGMLAVEAYRDAWERKRRWYEATGHAPQLITSRDREDGGIDAAEIERIARERILGEM